MCNKQHGTGNKAEIKFGTDGWRAVIGDTFTFENLKALSQATADFLIDSAGHGGKGLEVAIGFDTRFLSDKFAEIVACVFAANGIKVFLSDRHIPTPTLSYTVKERKLDLGVMITASHNPASFNGFKIKNSKGGSAEPGITQKIESLLFKNIPCEISLDEAVEKKLVVKENLLQAYIKFLRSYIVLSKLKNKKFKVLLDCMYGSGNGYMQEVIKGTKIELEVMHNEHNPSFGGRSPEPIQKNLPELLQRMKKENFDLGLVLDGDADRIAAVAKGGEFIHPQKILGLLALHLREDRKLDGGIVKTLAGTAMLDSIAQHLGLKLHETPVGFKYISELMENDNILVGGEEAGGMGFKNYIPERDGILAGLLLLEMMVFRSESIEKILRKMEDKFGRYYYLRNDLKLKKSLSKEELKKIRPQNLLGSKIVEVKDFDGVKFICQDSSWLMLRPSGTEPLVRIYAEAKSVKKTKELLECGEGLLPKEYLF